MKRREFHFFIAVWGKWHVETFLDLNLPTLLAADNLLYLAGKMDVRYHITTSASDEVRFKQSASFARLKEICQVELEVLPDSDFGNPVQTQMKLWHAAVARATEREAFLCPFPADMVWSNGSYRTVADLLLSGKKCIYAMFVRVIDETFSPEILRLKESAGGQELAVPSRDLMKVILRNIHPLHSAYLRHSEHFPGHSEYIYWPVKDEGLLMRSTATTVLVFDTKDRKVDDHFSIESFDSASEIGFIDDTDNMCGASITPFKKDWSWYLERRRLNIDDIGRWWLIFEGAASDELAKRYFRFHVGDCDESKWRRVERASDFVIQQSTAAREISRVIVELDRNQCRYAAKIAATALLAGRLRRRWHWRPPFVVLVPVDSAITPDHLSLLENLLLPGRDADLNKFVLDHVCSGVHVAGAMAGGAEEAAFDVTMFGGHRARFNKTPRGLTINGCKVVSELRLNADVKILMVDRSIIEPVADPAFKISSPDQLDDSWVIVPPRRKALLERRVPARLGNDFVNIPRYTFNLRRLAREAFSKPALSPAEAHAHQELESNLYDTLSNLLIARVADYFVAAVGQVAAPSGALSLLGPDVDRSISVRDPPASVHSWAAHIRGAIEDLRGHHLDSVLWYEKSIAAFSENGRTWRNIGELQLAAGRTGEARYSFARASELLPTDRAIRRHTGNFVRPSDPWKAAGEFLQATLLGVEIAYLPALSFSKDGNWIAIGPYRNFRIYANPGLNLCVACLQRHDVDLGRLEQAASSARVLFGLSVARATKWKLYRRLNPLFRDSPVPTSGSATTGPQKAAAVRLPVSLKSGVLYFLKLGRRALLSRPHLWQFAIVTSDLETLEETLAEIDGFLTPD